MTLVSNLRQGLWWGIAFAILYSGAALVMFLVRGFAPFLADGISFPRVLAMYWLGGLGGGLLYGLLLPLGRSLLGAMLLGFLVTVPVAAAASLLIQRQSHVPGPVLVVSFAAVLGPLAGAIVWNQARRGL